jgi:hypothetical protein
MVYQLLHGVLSLMVTQQAVVIKNVNARVLFCCFLFEYESYINFNEDMRIHIFN